MCGKGDANREKGKQTREGEGATGRFPPRGQSYVATENTNQKAFLVNKQPQARRLDDGQAAWCTRRSLDGTIAKPRCVAHSPLLHFWDPCHR